MAFNRKALALSVLASLATAGMLWAEPTSQPMAPLGSGDSTTQPSDSGTAGKHKETPQAARLEKEVDSVKPTDDEKTQLVPVFAKLNDAIAKVTADSSTSAADRKSQITDAIKDAMQDIKKILTPDQVTALKAARTSDGAGGGKKKKGGN